MQKKRILKLLLNLLMILLIMGGIYQYLIKTKFLQMMEEQANIEPEKPISESTKSLHTDLTKSIATLMIIESISASLLLSEMDLLSFYSQSTDLAMSDQSRIQLKECLNHLQLCQQLLSSMNVSDQKLEKTAFERICVSINDSLVCFVDPLQKIQWLNIEKKRLKQSSIFNEIYTTKKGKLADWHNFLIFYQHVRLSQLLNRPVTPQPPIINDHTLAQMMIDIFQQQQYFQDLDKFLQQYGFRKRPNERGWIYTTIYFDYVCKAYENGYINMALREFILDIESEPKTIKAFPNITPLKNYLILLQRYKLIK